ncbi:MAG: double zinc ribbon domain-containing protein [Patescibacteria group bacterium]
MLKFFKELIFPSRCLNCLEQTTEGLTLCEKCKDGIKLNQTLFCGQCLARLPEGKKICHKDFPYLLGAALDYKNEAARKLILGLKFGGAKGAAQLLGEFLVEYARSIPVAWQDFLIVPVPLSQGRRNQRGFNQSQLIAEVFAKSLGIEMSKENLVRIKNTPPQSEINNFDKRMKNVEGVFKVLNPLKFGNRKIVLVDDVTTSGATLKEATSVIKSCHPKNMLALTVARA